MAQHHHALGGGGGAVAGTGGEVVGLAHEPCPLHQGQGGIGAGQHQHLVQGSELLVQGHVHVGRTPTLDAHLLRAVAHGGNHEPPAFIACTQKEVTGIVGSRAVVRAFEIDVGRWDGCPIGFVRHPADDDSLPAQHLGGNSHPPNAPQPPKGGYGKQAQHYPYPPNAPQPPKGGYGQ